jgi:glycosyltransferase involved in cell wall biosynthesis
VGGIPNLLEHEKTGLLVGNEDIVGMATAVQRLLHEPDLAARLSANGRRLAEANSWPAVKQQWVSLFAQIVS